MIVQFLISSPIKNSGYVIHINLHFLIVLYSSNKITFHLAFTEFQYYFGSPVVLNFKWHFECVFPKNHGTDSQMVKKYSILNAYFPYLRIVLALRVIYFLKSKIRMYFKSYRVQNIIEI